MMQIVKKPKLDTHDILFITGSVLIVTGAALRSPTIGLIVAGALLLLAPVLNIVQGFIRGIKQ
jgi:hypothetical protein